MFALLPMAGFEVAQSSIAKYMSSDIDRRPSPGAPSCATMRRTSRPWICSLLRPLALICSMALSLFDWPAGAWSGQAHLRRILGAYAAYYNVERIAR
jgi:hypothetical protein